MDLNKNDNIEATVESLGYRGEGVARIDRVPVFIAGALPGERVRAHVILVKKDYAVAKLTDVLKSSPDRAVPRCKYFGKCGGCNIQHLSYNAQLKFKRETVADALKKIAHISFEVASCVPSDIEYGYRNKLSLPVRRGKNGAETGLFAYNSHRIVEIDDCPLQTERVRKLIPRLRETAARFKPYDEDTGRGELRHFVVRDFGNRVSLTVVATHDVSEKVRNVCSNSGADEVWLNINKQDNNVIMGDKTVLVTGEWLPHETLGIKTCVHPKGFMQVNDSVMKKLYSAVTERAKQINPDRIIDAYSGGGTLTALLSPYAKEVVGVEIEQAAVNSAMELTKDMELTNVRHICGDCAKVVPKLTNNTLSAHRAVQAPSAAETSDVLTATHNGDNTLIVLDPPRSGCDKAVVEAVNASGAENVIYVSCNPSTLARDLSLLTDYEPTSVTPYDMFPQTAHVETLVCLKRKQSTFSN